MPIDKNMLNELRKKLSKFEQKHQTIVTRNTTNSCTSCYSDGGCSGTCRGSCQSTCAWYRRSY